MAFLQSWPRATSGQTGSIRRQFAKDVGPGSMLHVRVVCVRANVSMYAVSVCCNFKAAARPRSQPSQHVSQRFAVAQDGDMAISLREFEPWFVQMDQQLNDAGLTLTTARTAAPEAQPAAQPGASGGDAGGAKAEGGKATEAQEAPATDTASADTAGDSSDGIKLTVALLRASGLPAEAGQISDPYVVLEAGGHVFQTRTQKATLDPTFNQSFEFEFASLAAVLVRP